MGPQGSREQQQRGSGGGRAAAWGARGTRAGSPSFTGGRQRSPERLAELRSGRSTREPTASRRALTG